MGLLSDPSQPEKISLLIHKYQNKASILAYVCGFLWFCLLAYKPYNGGTYISENALLPGLVEGHFKSDSACRKYLESFEQEVETHRSGIPIGWLKEQFTQMGLETYTHNFTLRHPLGKQIIYTGNNVYAILRAPRTANTESVVITAPFRTILSPHPATLPGIALMLAMAKFLRQQVYLAKDVIFLVTEHELLGVQAWLEAYHRSSEPDQALDGGILTGRAGSIQSAINLEIQSDQLTNLDVKVEGLNGQLPNLDLFNLVIRLCGREHVRATFQNKDDHYNPETPEGWVYSLGTMVSMMASQATGIPTGNHGLFLRYNIEAVTLRGYPHTGRGRKTNLLQVGRVLEGIVRSLNNLQERFHQSFFLYLLPATDRYVSIGLYMPAFGLLIAPLALKALGLRVEYNREEEAGKKGGKQMKQFSSFLSALPLFFFSHLLGVLIWMSPEYICKLGWHLEMTTEQALTVGLGVVFISSLALPFFVNRQDHGQSAVNWKIIKCIALLELGILLGPLSLINISLATFVTIFYSPVAVWIKPSRSCLASVFQSVSLLLISPVVLGFLAVLASMMAATFSTDEDVPLKTFEKSLNAYQRAIVHSIFDSHIFGNWLFAVASTVLFPSWLMLWTAAHTN